MKELRKNGILCQKA